MKNPRSSVSGSVATSLGGTLDRNDLIACGVILAIAFLTRVAGTALFEGLHAPPNASAFYDGVEFEEIARNLVQHGQFAVQSTPTSFRAPGLPFLLAAVYAVAGVGNYLFAHLALCAVGALVVLPVYLLGRLVGGRTVASLSALMAAVVPNVAYYSIHFASEPMHTLTLLLAIWLLAWSLTSRRYPAALAAGVALGVSALARPIAVYYLPFFLVALYLVRPRARALRTGLLLVAGTGMTILPWSTRNYLVHHRWLMIASNGGSTFWGSNNELVAHDPVLRGEWISTRILRGENSPLDRPPSEIDRDRLQLEQGEQWIRDHPGEAVRLDAWKLYKLWTPFPTSINRAFVWGSAAGYLFYIPFVIPGIWLLWRQVPETRAILRLMAAPVVGTVCAAIVFYGSARFRSPIEPLLMIPAATAMQWTYRRWRVGASPGKPTPGVS